MCFFFIQRMPPTPSIIIIFHEINTDNQKWESILSQKLKCDDIIIFFYNVQFRFQVVKICKLCISRVPIHST